MRETLPGILKKILENTQKMNNFEDFDDILGDIDDTFGIQGYQFEPEYTEEELREMEVEEARLRDAEAENEIPEVLEFCICKKTDLEMGCDRANLLDSKEAVCCRGEQWIDLLSSKCGQEEECITNHDDFAVVILHPAVLLLAFCRFLDFKKRKGARPNSLTNSQSRVMAYRQFVTWAYILWQQTGKEKPSGYPCLCDGADQTEVPKG
ncbi:unnamed protein product [Owenia fusiformis]|uniref:Uncharacterized protein n=1 Tax=Owenia fusiformis TaxID=6347 RepID=A0A8J1TT98_OWEFU|nr:unnamed protein product [Owenia fusiformis]